MKFTATHATPEQRKAIKALYDRSPNGSRSYIAFRRRVEYGFNCLHIEWCDMLIGIETNGYTHS